MTCSHLAIMLYTTLLSSFVIISANPFHKYPFVFLLDVGNEELDTVNTKQIRISAPGGSIALRYPAIGDGETIAHLRVSGIDFGTDLKANIIDGGPGYKYVVFVFMGNYGVVYDALVTIQTLPLVPNIGYSSEISNITENTYMNQRYDGQNSNLDTNNEISSDENNSAEDLSDDEVSNLNVENNKELSRSSSNVYYVEESSMDVKENRSNEPDEEDVESEENSHQEYSNMFKNQVDGSNVDMNEEITNDDNSGEIVRNTNNYEISEPRVEKYSENDDFEDESNGESVKFVDKNLYDKYQALKPHFYNNFNVYPQEFLYKNVRLIDNPESIDFEDPSELKQTYNDEVVHGNKYREDNNNYSDSVYGSIDYK